jgi:hypothetical protein
MVHGRPRPAVGLALPGRRQAARHAQRRRLREGRGPGQSPSASTAAGRRVP